MGEMTGITTVDRATSELLDLLSPEEAARVTRLQILLPEDPPDVPERTVLEVRLPHGSPNTRHLVLVCFYVWLQKQFWPKKCRIVNGNICRITVSAATIKSKDEFRAFIYRASWQCGHCSNCRDVCGGDPYIDLEERCYVCICCRCGTINRLKLAYLPTSFQSFCRQILMPLPENPPRPQPLPPPPPLPKPFQIADAHQAQLAQLRAAALRGPDPAACFAAAAAAAKKILAANGSQPIPPPSQDDASNGRPIPSAPEKDEVNGRPIPSAPSHEDILNGRNGLAGPEKDDLYSTGDDTLATHRERLKAFYQHYAFGQAGMVEGKQSVGREEKWRQVEQSNFYNRSSFYEWKTPKLPPHLRQDPPRPPPLPHFPIIIPDSQDLGQRCRVWGCSKNLPAAESQSLYLVRDFALRTSTYMRYVPNQHSGERFTVQLLECGECEGDCQHFQQRGTWCPPPGAKPLPVSKLAAPPVAGGVEKSSVPRPSAGAEEVKRVSYVWFWANYRSDLEQTSSMTEMAEKFRQIWIGTICLGPWKIRQRTHLFLSSFFASIEAAAEAHTEFMGESAALVKALDKILVPALSLLQEFAFGSILHRMWSLQSVVDFCLRTSRITRAMMARFIQVCSAQGLLDESHVDLWHEWDTFINMWRASDLRREATVWLKRQIRPGPVITTLSQTVPSMFDVAEALRKEKETLGVLEPPDSPPPPSPPPELLASPEKKSVSHDQKYAHKRSFAEMMQSGDEKTYAPPGWSPSSYLAGGQDEEKERLAKRPRPMEAPAASPKPPPEGMSELESLTQRLRQEPEVEESSGSESGSETDSESGSDSEARKRKRRRKEKDDGDGDDEDEDSEDDDDADSDVDEAGLSPYSRRRYARRLCMKQDPDSDGDDQDDGGTAHSSP